MDEQDLSSRLIEAATVGQPTPASVASDVVRGRRSLRRRTAAMAALPLAAVAVVGGVGAVSGLPNEDGRGFPGPDGFAGGGTTTPASARSPEATAASSSSDATSAPSTGRIHHQPAGIHTPTLPDSAGDIPYASWRRGLAQLAGQHLDPEHLYLNYETQSLQGGSNADGSRRLGIKLGWQQSGDSGEGMVQLALTSPRADGVSGCGGLPPCRTVEVPGFGEVRIGGDPNGQDDYSVAVQQADGEIAEILVTALFGNNSLTPTEAPLPSLERVLTLAQDPEFDLPNG